MSSWHSLLVLAAEGTGYGVGSGRIQGGWSYVWASYGIAWGGIALYAVSLWLRHRGQLERLAPPKDRS